MSQECWNTCKLSIRLNIEQWTWAMDEETKQNKRNKNYDDKKCTQKTWFPFTFDGNAVLHTVNTKGGNFVNDA